MRRILTGQHECIKRAAWETVSDFILPLCLGDPLRKRNSVTGTRPKVAVHNNIRDSRHLASLNLEIANREAIFGVAFDETGIARSKNLIRCDRALQFGRRKIPTSLDDGETPKAPRHLPATLSTVREECQLNLIVCV